jgi:hypothetical protein
MLARWLSRSTPKGDGLPGLIARAHDELVDALRQMPYVADMARRSYREGDATASQIIPPGYTS